MMYKIIAHVKPTPELEFDQEVKGAYVSAYIDYKDLDGALVLTKYYIQENGWEFIEWDEEYNELGGMEEMADENKQYYAEIMEYGYCMVYHMYAQIEDEEE